MREKTRLDMPNEHPRLTVYRLLCISGSLLLAACSGVDVVVQDSAPSRQVDHTQVKNAVPRVEPFSKYGNPPSYEIEGKRYYVLSSATGYKETGTASWYGTKFHGRRTSSGEPYDMYAMTAAHKTLPIPVFAEVTNLENGHKIIVRINDRGPFVDDRIIDLSYVAAKKLGITAKGTGRVSLRTIDPREPQTATSVALAAPVEQAPATTSGTTISPVATATAATVTSIPLTEASVTEATSSNPGQLYLQVGAFSDRNNASQLASKLTASTGENVFIKDNVSAEYTVYRVRIGPIDPGTDVEQLRLQLSKLGIVSPHIIVE